MPLETDPNQTQNQDPAAAPPAAQPPAAGGAPAPAPRNPVPASALPEHALLAKKQKWEAAAREQERRKVLADLGIEDPDKWRAEQEQRRQEEEKRRAQREQEERAKLTEVDRYKADLAARERERDEARREAEEARREASNAKIGAMARSAAAPHIADEMYDFAEVALKRHIASLSEHARRRFDGEDASEFFKDLAKKNPRFARAQPRRAAPPPARRPLTTGPSPGRTTTPAGSTPRPPDPKAGKTAAPGKENSMSDEEVRELAKKEFGFEYKPYGGGARSGARPNGAARGASALDAQSPTGARR